MDAIMEGRKEGSTPDHSITGSQDHSILFTVEPFESSMRVFYKT
jgi:hypothetical protein